MALSVFAFTGCGGGKVEINKGSITLAVGDTQKLTAISSDSKDEILWMSDNSSIATVDKKGVVTAKAAGTTTITAYTGDKPGKNAATCEVTVVGLTFTDEFGTAMTELIADRDKAPTKISLKTTDNSTVRSWSSSDTKLLSVVSEGKNGAALTAHRSEGSVTLTATTSSGLSAKINVKLEDTFNGPKYEIGTDREGGKWWYSFNEEGYRVVGDHFGELRGDVVTFEFDGNSNWESKDILLGYTGKEEYSIVNLNMKVESSVETPITIFSGATSTSVYLDAGDNEVSVRLPWTDGFEIWFGNSKYGGDKIQNGKFVITDIVYTYVEEQTLDNPTFTVEESSEGHIITIDDGVKKEGVEQYTVCLFKDGADKATLTQTLMFATDTIDTALIGPEDKGEYIVKLKAIGAYGWIDSDWVTLDDTITINNEHVKYDLAAGGSGDAMSSNRWFYYVVDGGEYGNPRGTYEDGAITYTSDYLGWAFYSTMLLRNYSEYEVGTQLLVGMNIHVSASEADDFVGHITVADDSNDYKVRTLKPGDNYIEFVRTQRDDDPTISIMFGVYPDVPDFPTDNQLDFVFTDVTVVPYNGATRKLTAPSGATLDDETKVVSTPNISESEEKYISGYQVTYYNESGIAVKTFDISNGDSIDDSKIDKGTYTVKIKALAGNVRTYTDSDEAVLVSELVIDRALVYDIPFGGSGDPVNANNDPGVWYYWNDQNWVGSDVTIDGATYNDGTITIPYTASGACDFGIQLYYKSPKYAYGQIYEIAMNIKTNADISVVIFSETYDLKVGDNAIKAYYTQTANEYSCYMAVKINGDEVPENVLVISDMVWSPYTYKTLAAPSITGIDAEGKITISDTNAAENVKGYNVSFYLDNVKRGELTVQNGDILEPYMLESNTYTVKVIALPGPGYLQSAESAGYEYKVVNEHIRYDFMQNPDGTYGFNEGDARSNPGIWGVWAGQWEWTEWKASVNVTEARYEDGKIIISFTSEGTCDWALRLYYVNPAFEAGTSYEFDIVATSDMNVQVENGEAAAESLNAGVSRHLYGGSDDSFYLQVNIKDGLSGTITISNVEWN